MSLFIGGITPNAIGGLMICHNSTGNTSFIYAFSEVLRQPQFFLPSQILYIVFTSATSCFLLVLCKHDCVVTTSILIVYIPLLIA